MSISDPFHMDKTQTLTDGLLHFQNVLKDQLGMGKKVPALRVAQVDHDCDLTVVASELFHNHSTYELKQSLAPDALRIQSGAGPIQEATRTAGPDGLQKLTIFANAIVYEEVFVDTMFERGVVHVVRSFNGFLRLRYRLPPPPSQAELAKRFDFPPDPPEPRPLPGDDEATYRENHARWRAWWEHAPENGLSPQQKRNFLQDIASQISASYAARVAEALRSDPVLGQVQQDIWGQPDPNPTPWYVAPDETG